MPDFPWGSSARAHPVPHHMGDDGGAGVRHHDHFEAVIELAVEGEVIVIGRGRLGRAGWR